MSAEIQQTQMNLIEDQMSREPTDVQSRYRALLKKGNTPQFAAMLATQSPPATQYSDKTFNREMRDKMESMSGGNRDILCAAAKSSGISTQGKYYVGSLGRPTEPGAWVSTIDEAHDTCKKKNLTVHHGVIKHTGHAVPPKKVGMAPDIVNDYIRRECLQEPSLLEKISKRPSSLNEVREKVIHEHACSRAS